MNEFLNDIYTQERFERLKNKKLLIYGTGKYAERLVKALNGFEIVGVIDRIHFEGMFMGLPILIWDDIERDTIDAIIIASMKRNYHTIFDRIQYQCISLGITVYGENGQNLSKEYQLKYITPEQNEYFQKNESELKRIIDQYDAVSFDLFDTLIMRKVLEPTDVFDLVEDNLRKKGIRIPAFKKKRRTAELQANTGNIYKIYDRLQEITGFSRQEREVVLQEELNCEQLCLIPRKAMVEIMNYAVRKGKRISIISDMYLPANIIKPLLNHMGICGYHRLYISCEYGRGKGNGIFEIYRTDMGKMRCIHIGDDIFADVIAPRRYGIDSYEIKSAYEMLKMSSMRKALVCSRGINNRIALGLMLAEEFNDPFALYGTSGLVPIKTPDAFAKVFIAPTVLIYMQKLMECLRGKDYKRILFTARDGYLFKKIYDKHFLKDSKIPGIYFFASRKLCLASVLNSKEDILELGKWLSTGDKLKHFLEEFLDEEIVIEQNKKSIDIESCLIAYSEKLKRSSKAMNKNYVRYIDNILTTEKSKCLFCELNSSGTVHEALNKIFQEDLDGFYLCRTKSFRRRELKISSVYNERKWDNIAESRDMLEIVLTAPHPSIRAMDENGEAVYASESRAEPEIQLVMKAQNAIMDFVRNYVELRGTERSIDKELPEVMLGLRGSVKYQGEANEFVNLQNVDDMTQVHIPILNE